MFLARKLVKSERITKIFDRTKNKTITKDDLNMEFKWRKLWEKKY